jgi:secondary thiamine-phosphate synthase enzyme
MFQQCIQVDTQAKSLHNITANIETTVRQANIQSGLCHVFIQHTSCSLIISENADPDVLIDLKNFMAKLVPEKEHYKHNAEGQDDMPAHIRSVLTQTQLCIPIQENTLMLGCWQGVYLWEHRARSHQRQIIITLQE